jgi:hypothetical protein
MLAMGFSFTTLAAAKGITTTIVVTAGNASSAPFTA